MAKSIEFYIPDKLREMRLWSPREQHGKVIEFPPTEITVLIELNSAKQRSWVRKEENDPSLCVSAKHLQHSGDNLGQGQLYAMHRVADFAAHS